MNTAIKVIETEHDHTHAVAHLLKLIAIDSDEHNQTIESLALLIQDYERKVSSTPTVNPTDAAKFRTEQMGMVVKE